MNIDTDALSDALNTFSNAVHDFVVAVSNAFVPLVRLINDALIDLWRSLDPRHDQDKYALLKAELLAQLKAQLYGPRAELAFEVCNNAEIVIMVSSHPGHLTSYDVLLRLVKVFLAFDGHERYSFNDIVAKIERVQTYIDLLSLEVEIYDLGEDS